MSPAFTWRGRRGWTARSSTRFVPTRKASRGKALQARIEDASSSANRERRLEVVMEGPNVDTVIEPGPAREAENGLVDIGAAQQDSNVEDVLAELDRELVGLRPVKAR